MRAFASALFVGYLVLQGCSAASVSGGAETSADVEELLGGQYPVPGFMSHLDFIRKILYKIQPNQFHTVLL